MIDEIKKGLLGLGIILSLGIRSLFLRKKYFSVLCVVFGLTHRLCYILCTMTACHYSKVELPRLMLSLVEAFATLFRQLVLMLEFTINETYFLVSSFHI